MARHGLSADDIGSLFADPRRWVRFGAVLRVVDGDTFDCRLDLGHRISVDCRFRLFGVNAPERGQPGWDAATSAMKWILLPLIKEELAVVTWKDRRDKYGRYVADVAVPVDPKAAPAEIKATDGPAFAWLSDWMLSTGTVEEYLP